VSIFMSKFRRWNMAAPVLKTSAEYAAELGRAQQAYKQYGTAGRADLQKGASTYADKLRLEAKAGGVDLSGEGNKNAYGTDYTKSYTGATAGAYDPTKAGQVQRLLEPVSTVVPVTTEKKDVVTNATETGTTNNNDGLINQQYDNNYKSQLQKLQEARQIQQQGLNQQETGVNQNALQNLNNNDAMAAQQLKQLQEVMANNGVRGGDSITATIGNQTAQQNGANSINQDRANQLRDISEKRSLIDNNASANDLAMMQQLQAVRSGQLIDNNNTQDQRSMQLAQLMGSYGGNRTLAGQQFDQGVKTDDRNFNYGAKRDTVLDNRYDQQFDYTKGIDSRNFDYQKAQDSIKTGQFDKTFELELKRFAEGNKLNWAKMSLETKQVLGQLAIGQQNANTNAFQASTSANNQAANLQLNREKFAYDKDPNNLDNIYKASEINWKNSESAKNYAVANKGAAGADEYDLLQVNSLAEKAGISATTSPADLKMFVADLKGKYGWDLSEAKTIEGYLTKQQQDAKAKADAAKAEEKPKGFGYRGFGG
jgi:hypothetical protein